MSESGPKFNKFPGDTDTVGPGTTRRRHWHDGKHALSLKSTSPGFKSFQYHLFSGHLGYVI